MLRRGVGCDPVSTLSVSEVERDGPAVGVSAIGACYSIGNVGPAIVAVGIQICRACLIAATTMSTLLVAQITTDVLQILVTSEGTPLRPFQGNTQIFSAHDLLIWSGHR